MLPFARASLRVRYSFQQDNDPKHTFNHIKEELEKCVFGIRARNADQNFSQLQTAWAQIPQYLLTNLIQSMPRRCQAVIDL
uniref:Uncharacterized protein n=1 Tax=Caenorhabditis japonica TaxID=281687 RepID=A0A8R1II39_CAEJA